jgi:hypothetical protein
MRKFLAILFAGLLLAAVGSPAADAKGGGGGSKPCICLPPTATI